MSRRFILLFLSLSCFSILHAATVDTIVIQSQAMKRDIKCVVIRPGTEQDSAIALPVVYLLHGWSGSYNNWIVKVPALRQYADDFNLMIVCPDGGYNGWYIDSPVEPSIRYETYIAKEVPAYIDAHYATIRNRRARAITGLSMGGHGGLLLALRHADFFGACGSMSGAVDLLSIARQYQLLQRLGDTVRYADYWRKLSVITAVDNPPSDSLAIIIDCGTEDFFWPANRRLHEKLLKLKVSHDYIERPGKHDWVYWANAVHYQLVYFRNYFDKMNR